MMIALPSGNLGAMSLLRPLEPRVQPCIFVHGIVASEERITSDDMMLSPYAPCKLSDVLSGR
jgi:hypothetical protein